MATPHSYQIVDGGDVIAQIAALPLPVRVTATRNPTTGILTYTNQPALYTGVGPTSNKLLELAGSSEFNTTFGKSNKVFRLFNDSGWEQDKITGRQWQATMQGLFVRNTSTTNPDLEDSFKLIFENALDKESEVYIKFLKNLGIIAESAALPVTAANATETLTFAAAQTLSTGARVTLAATTVPTGLAAGDYYVIVVSPTVVRLAATYDDAVAETPVPVQFSTDGTDVTLTIAARIRYQVESGNAKVINFGDQAMADGILNITATFKGQERFIYGFDEVSVAA